MQKINTNKVKELLYLGLMVGYICGLTVSVGSLTLGKYHYLLDMSSHFHLQLMVGLLILTTLIVLISRKKQYIALITYPIFLTFLILPVQFKADIPTNSPDIYYINENVLIYNKEKVPQQIADIDAQTTIVVELRTNTDDFLRKTYPHQVVHNQGAYSCGIYSYTQPISYEIILDIYPTCTVEFPDYHLVVIHPYPPLSNSQWQKQKEYFSKTADLLARLEKEDKPFVLVGDFNSTSYSQVFRDNFSKYHKENIYTWRPGYILTIPIDHIMSNTEISVHRLPLTESDHSALVMDFK